MQLVEIFLHLDRFLGELIAAYGAWVYGILFLTVFCETGLVVTPFLPGDSLLFAAGTFAAIGSLDITSLLILFSAAAILGDAVNYATGKFIGPKVFSRDRSFFFRRDYLDRTQRFYERHGGKTIIIARFIPIIRTFAPFVAGIGRMHPVRFFVYNVIGGILWVCVFTLLGYGFGNVPIVAENFSFVVLGIIVISTLPIVWEGVKGMARKGKSV